MNKNPIAFGLSAPLFLCFLALLFIGFTAFSQETADTTGADSAVQNTEAAKPAREPLEEVVVRGRRRHRVDLGELFEIETVPEFVEPEAIRVESENLPSGQRFEKFTIGERQYCFEIRAANPLDSFDRGLIYQRPC